MTKEQINKYFDEWHEMTPKQRNVKVAKALGCKVEPYQYKANKLFVCGCTNNRHNDMDIYLDRIPFLKPYSTDPTCASQAMVEIELDEWVLRCAHIDNYVITANYQRADEFTTPMFKTEAGAKSFAVWIYYLMGKENS